MINQDGLYRNQQSDYIAQLRIYIIADFFDRYGQRPMIFLKKLLAVYGRIFLTAYLTLLKSIQ